MLRGNMAATGIGSLPHSAAGQAVDAVLRYLPEVPFCPQLPRLDPGEGMYEQVAGGIPGLRRDGDRMWVDTGPTGLEEMEQLAPGPDTERVHPLAAAQVLLERDLARSRVLKGQVAGPVSLGLSLTDENRRPLLYNPEFMLAAAQVLSWKASWLERILSRAGRPTLILVDEPYLNTLGSGHFAYSHGLVRDLLDIVLEGIEGMTGIHCCGNTDWPLLLETGVDVLSFDAADHFKSVSLYPGQVASFLARGGNLGWGIVPTEGLALEMATAERLADQIDEQIGDLVRRGVSRQRLVEQSLVTPACGLASRDRTQAERALRLAGEVSALMRCRHDLGEIGLGKES